MRQARQTLIMVSAILACLSLLLFFIRSTSFSASVVDLLTSENSEARILRELATESPGRVLTVRLFTRSEGINSASQAAFANSLQQSDSISKIWKSGQESLADAGSILFKDRYFWLLPNWIDQNMDNDSTAASINPEKLAGKVVEKLESYLDSPDSLALEDLIPRDPFLLMDQLENLNPSIKSAESNKESILWIEQAGSPFEDAAQDKLFQSLDEALHQAQQIQADLEMEYTGIALFASASKKGIKQEIQRLNLLGIGLVLLIVLYTVRKLSLLLRIALVLAMGLLAASTAVVTIFESVHIIALVIGSILTGIAVDYGFHMLLRERECLSDKQTRKVVIAGSLSSALGFLFLMGAPIPFLQQVGVFVGFGLIAAMATSLIVAKEMQGYTPLRAINFKVGFLPLWTGALVTILAVPGLFMLSWSSNIQDIEYPLPELVEKDSRIRAISSPLDERIPYLLHGEDIIDCRDKLQDFDPHGKMSHAGTILPTLEKVRSTQAIMQQVTGFKEALLNQLDQAGFYPEAFEGFLNDWNDYLNVTISDESYRAKITAFANALPGPLQNFIHCGQEISWFMILATDPIPKGPHPDLVPLNQSDMLSREFAIYGHTMWLFAAACILILGFSVCVFFGIKPGLEAIAVPLASSISTFGILGIWNGQFGLFHLVGATLAFCISLDYGLFAATSRSTGKDLPKSISVSSITTLVVFGVLATSHLPGVKHLAITVILVMAFSLMFICMRWPGYRKSTSIPFAQIPHGKEALMVESIKALETRKIVATCIPHRNQSIPIECLVEAMAQCAAILLASSQNSTTKRSGLLVVVQSVNMYTPFLRPGQSITATVNRLSDSREGLVQFAGECSDQTNNMLTDCRFSIFIPPKNTDS